jgi:hypothetical protein
VEALRPGSESGVHLIGRKGVELAGVEAFEELVFQTEPRVVAVFREWELPELAMEEKMPFRNVEEDALHESSVKG